MASNQIVAPNQTTSLVSYNEESIPKKPKPQVVEEDEYLQALDHIIQRDFFPDLKNLRRQMGAPLPDNDINKLHVPDDVSLDQFVATHTSEDNASFSELMEKQAEDTKKKFAWAYDNEKKANDRLLMPPPARVEAPLTWKFRAKNALMYYPTGQGVKQIADQPQKELQLVGNKRTLYQNTRFQPESKADIDQFQAFASAKQQQIQVQLKRYRNGTGNDSFRLATPTPVAEAAIDSPFITWGDVVGTPVHLGTEDNLGPSFRLSKPNSREQTGLDLAEKSRKKQRPPSTQCIHQRPLSNRPGSSTPALSQAAQRLLARSSKRVHTDRQLRASYSTPTSHHPNKAAVTPSFRPLTSTPISRSPVPSSISSSQLGIESKKETSSLTDGLLNI